MYVNLQKAFIFQIWGLNIVLTKPPKINTLLNNKVFLKYT